MKKDWHLRRSFFVCGCCRCRTSRLCRAALRGVDPAPGCTGASSIHQYRTTSLQARQDFRHDRLACPQRRAVGTKQNIAVLNREHRRRSAGSPGANSTSGARRFKHPGKGRALSSQGLHHRRVKNNGRGPVARGQPTLRCSRDFGLRYRRLCRSQLNSGLAPCRRQYDRVTFDARQSLTGR